MPGVSFASHVQAFSTLHDAAVFAQTADGRPYSHSFKVVAMFWRGLEFIRGAKRMFSGHWTPVRGRIHTVVDVVDDDYP